MRKFVRVLVTGEPLAGLATLAGILAFIAVRRPPEPSPNDSTVLGFLSYWWPEILFYLSMAVVLCFLAFSYFRPKPIVVQRHRFTFLRVPGQSPVYPQGSSRVMVSSGEEHFAVQVVGKIFGPELRDVLSHYRRKTRGAGSPPPNPVYVLVSELTRSQEKPLWWPQNRGILAEDGTYEINCFLGGTGIDSAEDGEVFELRTYLPLDPAVAFPPFSCFDSITQLPKSLFLSESLYVTSQRPSAWKAAHSKLLQNPE
jgi:hypothetical protein